MPLTTLLLTAERMTSAPHHSVLIDTLNTLFPLAPTQKRSASTGFAAIQNALGELLDGATLFAVVQLREAIVAGQIDGACYTGSSRCVRGWLEVPETEHSFLVEGFLYPVVPGQMPETNGRLRRILAWIEAWLDARNIGEGGAR